MHAVPERSQSNGKKKEEANKQPQPATPALTDEGMSRDKEALRRGAVLELGGCSSRRARRAATRSDAKAVVAGLVGGAASRVRRPAYLDHHHHNIRVDCVGRPVSVLVYTGLTTNII